ncbi:MAG: TA system antitoxin ParD family protein [Aeromonas sp.]
MAQTVRLDDSFVAEAKIYASAAHRSLPKQIEYWSKIGHLVEDNPDLPFSFIKDVLLAADQVKEGQVIRYVRTTARD